MHLFLALESGAPVFVNKDSNAASDEGCSREPSEKEVLYGPLRKYLKGTRVEAHEEFPMDISRWPTYNLVGKNGANQTAAQRATRLSHHRSQHLRSKQCVDMIVAAEELVGGARYDAVLKLRDNTLVLQPVAEVPRRTADGGKAAVVCKRCRGWMGGVSDKVMVVPRARLQDALGSVYDTILRVQEGDAEMIDRIASRSDVRNAETLLAATLRYRGVPVAKVGTAEQSDELPFVDGRCRGTRQEAGGLLKEWCLVSECKDCRPRGAWTVNVSECPNSHCNANGWLAHSTALSDEGAGGGGGSDDEEDD